MTHSSQQPSQEEISASLKRQKIEQYASVMRKSALNTTGNSSLSTYEPLSSMSMPKPAPISIPPPSQFVPNHDGNTSTSNLTPSTVTQAPTSRRASKKPKSNSKSNTKTIFLPPPIAQSDIRRNFTKNIFNGYNSCDIKIIQQTVEEYMIKDMVAVHRYEGKRYHQID